MPIEREEAATPKTTRRRSSAIAPDVTEAKRPTSAAGITASGITMPVTETPRNAEDEIRRRAYELYEQDGREHGRDREHWLRAETEVLGSGNRASERAPRRSQKSA
jgi:hypothetical protein